MFTRLLALLLAVSALFLLASCKPESPNNENPNNNPVHSHANRKTSGKYAEPLFIIILGFVTTVPTIPWQFLDTLMPIIFSGSQYKRAGSGLGEGKEGV